MDDPYTRRKVKQLTDVNLIEEQEPEELMNLKRQPLKVMTEENLVRVLTEETERLNLENHYWLSTTFLGKLGMMAPNITELSLRRMSNNITNVAFAEMFKCMKFLEIVDLSDCTGLHSSALQMMVKGNPNLEELQLSGCVNAIDDLAMKFIAESKQLTFLDVSYSKKLTDQGLMHFVGGENTAKLQSLIMNGCSNVTSAGMIQVLSAC